MKGDAFQVLKGLTKVMFGVDIADADIPGLDLVTDAATLAAGLATGIAAVVHGEEQPQLKHTYINPIAETVAASV